MADHDAHENEEDIYELLGQDAMAWLRQAEFLRMSAALVLEKFREISTVFQVQQRIPNPMVAFSQSFMFLTGWSFENLIKGVDVAKTPGLSTKDRLKRWKPYDGGHGLLKLMKLIAPMNAEEENLLRRLEVYTMWAGRYPVPTSADRYYSAQKDRTLNPTRDPLICDALFERLASRIRTIALA